MRRAPKIKIPPVPEPVPIATPSEFLAPINSGAPPAFRGNVIFADRIPPLAFRKAQRAGRKTLVGS